EAARALPEPGGLTRRERVLSRGGETLRDRGRPRRLDHRPVPRRYRREGRGRGRLRVERRPGDPAARQHPDRDPGVPRRVVRTEWLPHAVSGRSIDRGRRVLQHRLAWLGEGPTGWG